MVRNAGTCSVWVQYKNVEKESCFADKPTKAVFPDKWLPIKIVLCGALVEKIASPRYMDTRPLSRHYPLAIWII